MFTVSNDQAASTPTVQFGLSRMPEKVRVLSAQILLLLLGLYVNHRLERAAAPFWIVLSLALAAILAKARYTEAEKPAVRLWQLVGVCAAIYSLLHYPLMPVLPGRTASLVLYVVLLVMWVATTAAGALCFRVPSLAVLPAAFLLWSNAMGKFITGLPTTVRVDIQPLPEVSACLGIGLLINYLCRRFYRQGENSSAAALEEAQRDFAHLFFLLAIAIHLANYFWAFYTKMTLDGPWGAWPITSVIGQGQRQPLRSSLKDGKKKCCTSLKHPRR